MSETKTAAEKKRPDLGRYEFFKLANAWVKVIKRTDEGKGLTTAELIKKAMDDISSGDVTAEEIEKKSGKLKPEPVAESEDSEKKEKEFKKSEKESK